MNAFWGYWIGVCGNLMTLFFMGMILPRRWGLWSFFVATFLCGLSIFPRAYFGYYSAQAAMVNALLAVAMVLILPALLFRAAYWKCFGVNLYFYGLNMLCDAVTVEMLKPYVGDLTVTVNIYDTIFYGAVALTLMVICYSVSVLLFHMLSMRRFRPFYLLFAVFPIDLYLFVYCIFFDLPGYILLAALVLGIACNIALLIHTLEQEKKAELETELQAVRRARELEESHYRAVEEQREALARIRHDFNNQLSAIGGLIQTGETEEARAMVSRLTADIAATAAIPERG